jgi:TetR/AcrR family transcriptional regulator
MRRGRKKIANPAMARRILAAAERCFAERGLAGARTDEIAAAAHANKAMLYYYYGNKGRLHRAVLEHLFSELRGTIEAAHAAGATPRERLLAFINGYFDFLAGHPNYPRLVQREVMQSSGQIRWVAENFFRPFHQRMCQTIEEGIAAGEFRPVDPHHTVFTIVAMTVFYFAAAPMLSAVLGHDVRRPKAVQERKRAILDFLTHALFLPETRAS